MPVSGRIPTQISVDRARLRPTGDVLQDRSDAEPGLSISVVHENEENVGAEKNLAVPRREQAAQPQAAAGTNRLRQLSQRAYVKAPDDPVNRSPTVQSPDEWSPPSQGRLHICPLL